MKTKDLLLRILKLLLPYKTRLVIAGISLLTVVVCLLTIGFVIRHFIDFQLIDGNYSMIYLITLITLFGIASFFRSYLINSTADFATNDAKKEAYKNLLEMNPVILDEYSFSDLASRINSDSEYISTVIIDVTSFFLRNIMTTTGGIILMFYNSPKLSIIAFSVIALITILSNFLSKKVRNLAKNAESAKSKTSNIVFESIINNKVIHAFKANENLVDYFNLLNKDTLDKVTIRQKYRSIFFASVITSMLITLSGIIWIGTLEVSNGNISSGTLASFIFYSFMTALSFGGIIEMANDLEKNLANCERFFEVFEFNKNSKCASHPVIPAFLEPESPSKQKEIIDINNGLIEFQNISYKYSKSGDIRVLNNLSIKFEIGKFSVITGKSGGGKTTILNLLMGLYQPNSGNIVISGKDYSKIYSENWGGKLSYVPQDNMLFSGSIINNISFFDKDPDIMRITEILEGLDLKNFIEDLPEGLETDIGSLASKVSGGQKQRLAIARAIYANPEILILDESTSQLDEKTETKVLDYLKSTLNGKTIICVAHRRGAIEAADRVVEI